MKKFILFFLVLILSSCSGARRATVEYHIIEGPRDSKALLSFIRGGQREAVTLWNQTKFIGFVIPHSILQYEISPGNHLLMSVTGRRASFKEITVTAGNCYIIKIVTERNGFSKFVPIDPTVNPERVDRWFEKYQYIQPDPEKKIFYESKWREGIVKRYQDYQKSIDAPLVPIN